MGSIPDIENEYIKTPLLWNGTFLGKYGINSIKHKKTINKITFATISTTAFYTKCILRRSKDPVMLCILDELKDCFNIEKIGTHHIKLGNSFYIMIRCVNEKGISNIKNNLVVDEDFKLKMRKLICYRMLLHIPNTNNRSFLVIENEINYKPYSFIESGICTESVPKPPTVKFLKKWFNDKDISTEIINIFPKKVYEEWYEFLLGFRSILENKICQINKEYVWLISFIIEKMNSFC